MVVLYAKFRFKKGPPVENIIKFLLEDIEILRYTRWERLLLPAEQRWAEGLVEATNSVTHFTRLHPIVTVKDVLLLERAMVNCLLSVTDYEHGQLSQLELELGVFGRKLPMFCRAGVYVQP